MRISNFFMGTVLLGFMAVVNAQTNLYADRSGNTTGTIGTSSVNTYRDRSGNTTGTIGDTPINRYTDRFGNTTGR